jgi:membrane fusion protein (multidrug efflux system)
MLRKASVGFWRGLAGPALFALALAAATHGAQAQQGERPPAEVTVVTLKVTDVTLTSTLPGRVVASAVAEVRPQVDGIITERLYEEGAPVEVGDPLYRIDQDAYAAQVAAAQAQVAQAEAQLKSNEQEATRIRTLIERKVASEQNLEVAIAARDSAAAALKVAQANLMSAQIELDRTVIKAPLTGVIGRSLTTQGALASAGQATPLAVIRTLDPVLVDVTQSAAELIAWRRGLTSARLADVDQDVALILADGVRYEKTGLLKAAEPSVDEQTGVVTLRLQFPNPDSLLLPGMYVQVIMPQGVVRDVVLAPQQGVTRDRRGNPQALVANADNVVEQRALDVIQAKGDQWIVRSGLGEGDRIIVEGLQKIAPGAKVAPVERAPAAAAATQ